MGKFAKKNVEVLKFLLSTPQENPGKSTRAFFLNFFTKEERKRWLQQQQELLDNSENVNWFHWFWKTGNCFNFKKKDNLICHTKQTLIVIVTFIEISFKRVFRA
jgi:hypothetical protein